MKNNETTQRRMFLKQSLAGSLALVTGLTIPALLSTDALANGTPDNLFQTASTEAQFRAGVIGPAELSKITSQIAETKATNKFAKQFASFEHTEAIAVTAVLKDLGTAVPPMDAKAKATLDKIKNTPKGLAFDKAYIKAQYENHVFLRTLAENYLKNSTGTSAAESQGRHLATLALATFKEHVAITRDILTQLGG